VKDFNLLSYHLLKVNALKARIVTRVTFLWRYFEFSVGLIRTIVLVLKIAFLKKSAVLSTAVDKIASSRLNSVFFLRCQTEIVYQ